MIELRRSIRSGHYYICSLMIIVSFLLGYILTKSIDKVEVLPYDYYYLSVFTVYSQFGILLYSVPLMNTISSDYKDKTIMFYRMLGFKWLTYLVSKIVVSLFWMSLPTLVLVIITSTIYGDFSLFVGVLIALEYVVFFQTTISLVIAFILPSLIVGYVSNVILWLFSIALSTNNAIFENLARYDASNTFYFKYEEFLKTKDLANIEISRNIIFLCALTVVLLSLCLFFRRKWLKNGM